MNNTGLVDSGGMQDGGAIGGDMGNPPKKP